MADSRVGGGHGVEAITLMHLLIERAAHDEPHHHLDAFAAGFAQVFDVRNGPRLLAVTDQQVHEHVVPFRSEEHTSELQSH